MDKLVDDNGKIYNKKTGEIKKCRECGVILTVDNCTPDKYIIDDNGSKQVQTYKARCKKCHSIFRSKNIHLVKEMKSVNRKYTMIQVNKIISDKLTELSKKMRLNKADLTTSIIKMFFEDLNTDKEIKSRLINYYFNQDHD
jgi:hypothetical protein